jgi:hypothetical protein
MSESDLDLTTLEQEPYGLGGMLPDITQTEGGI